MGCHQEWRTNRNRRVSNLCKLLICHGFKVLKLIKSFFGIFRRKLSTDFDREVRKVLLDIIVKKGQMYESGAKELLHKMEEQNRLKIVYNEYSLVN